MTALAAPLRKLPALKVLSLFGCEIGNEGVASLMADLRKDEFKALEELYLYGNPIGDASVDLLVVAIQGGGLPQLKPPGTGLFTNADGLGAAEARVASALAKRRLS